MVLEEAERGKAKGRLRMPPPGSMDAAREQLPAGEWRARAVSRKFRIFTYGCQMNRYDTETITGYLGGQGYEETESNEEADLILLNTCSIRDKAEQKVYSQIGRLEKLKASRPDLKIGVCGCFAARDGEAIAKRRKSVDLVFSTQNIASLPTLLEEMEKGRVVDTAPVAPDFDELAPIERGEGVNAFVSIARGCDNFCSFCVVPYTRGPEWSKPGALIVEEVERAAAEGFREVTLLGQNVNSYGKKSPGELTFGGLLRRLNEVEGIERIRFMTSHPKDCDEDMVDAMAESAKVCEHLHLPVQSGSDDVLLRMERGYTAEEYLGKAALFKERVRGGTLTSDVIIGFPGERDEDFEATLRMMREARYDNIYMFKYSPRPGTPAFGMEGAPPEEAVSERFEEASRLQREIAASLRAELVGGVQEVMVERAAKPRGAPAGCAGCPEAEDAPTRWFSGRGRGNHRVELYAEGIAPAPGDLVEVRIMRGGVHSLAGVSPPEAVRMEEDE